MKYIMLVIFSLSIKAYSQKKSDIMPVQNLNQIEWKPKHTLPPGAVTAIVLGDPTKGSYDFYGKFPANYTVPMHWHTYDCMVVIIKGSMTIKRENASDVVVEEGGFFMLPGNMKYIAYCPSECIFLVHGEKPFDIFYADRKDDPRNKAESN